MFFNAYGTFFYLYLFFLLKLMLTYFRISGLIFIFPLGENFVVKTFHPCLLMLFD